MNINQAKKILSKHAPLQKAMYHDELIIGDKNGWPFCLETTEEMEALITLVNELCVCLPNPEPSLAATKDIAP